MTVFVSRKGRSPRPAFAADARLLESAEGDAEVGSERVVADGARSELAGDLAGPVGIVSEHRSVQAVDRVVGDVDRVLLVIGGDHAQHRPEDLLLGDSGRVVDVPEDGGLDEPAAAEAARPGAARGQRRSLLDSLGDVALDPVALTLHGQGAHAALGIEGVADADVRERVAQGIDQLVVTASRDDDSGQGRAHLAGHHASAPVIDVAAVPMS